MKYLIKVTNKHIHAAKRNREPLWRNCPIARAIKDLFFKNVIVGDMSVKAAVPFTHTPNDFDLSQSAKRFIIKVWKTEINDGTFQDLLTNKLKEYKLL